MTSPDDDRPAGAAPPAANDNVRRPSDQAAAGERAADERTGAERNDRPPHSRTGTVWVSICVTVLVLGLLIVFIAQNTETVNVTFLWMEGAVPLAIALLIAAAGAGLLATIVGTVRIAQLRRFHRRS